VKADVLAFIADHESVNSWTVAIELGYATRSGAAATLLRLHRHGHLHRHRNSDRSYLYAVSPKGLRWLEWWSAHGWDAYPRT
jgi:hypothetical protein